MFDASGPALPRRGRHRAPPRGNLMGTTEAQQGRTEVFANSIFKYLARPHLRNWRRREGVEPSIPRWEGRRGFEDRPGAPVGPGIRDPDVAKTTKQVAPKRRTLFAEVFSRRRAARLVRRMGFPSAAQTGSLEALPIVVVEALGHTCVWTIVLRRSTVRRGERAGRVAATFDTGLAPEHFAALHNP